MGPNFPGEQRPPFANQQSEAQMMWQAIQRLETNMQQMVNHINKWVAKIQGIDSVAFAALFLHDGKEFKLDEEAVTKNQEEIQKVLAEMGRYREVMRQKAQEEQQAEAAKGIGGLPAPAKKPQEPAPKKVEVKDGNDGGAANPTEG